MQPGDAHVFPADRPEYMATLGLGALADPALDVALLVRDIPRTRHRDALFTWPYSEPDVDDLDRLLREPVGIVSLVGVLNPALGWTSLRKRLETVAEVRPLKEHFVFDPQLPTRQWSASTRAKIRRSLTIWSPADVDHRNLECVVTMYRAGLDRRHARGTSWDFPRRHFEVFVARRDMHIRGMLDGEGELGAFACVITHGGDSHVVHMGASDEGRRTSASYGLMSSMVEECRASGRRLFLSGLPQGNPSRSADFKVRWANTTRTAYLLTAILDAEAYWGLPQRAAAGFFPRYRGSW